MSEKTPGQNAREAFLFYHDTCAMESIGKAEIRDAAWNHVATVIAEPYKLRIDELEAEVANLRQWIPCSLKDMYPSNESEDSNNGG